MHKKRNNEKYDEMRNVGGPNQEKVGARRASGAPKGEGQKGGARRSGGPKVSGPEGRGGPKFRTHFRSFFSLCRSSRGILVVFEALGPSNVHVWSSRAVV